VAERKGFWSDEMSQNFMIGGEGAISTSLLSPKIAACRLGISTKTLKGHVDDGELRYINVGRGKKKTRRMFTGSDLDEFIERRGRRDVPCQSTNIKKVRSTTSTSSSKVIGFTDLRDARTREKLTHLNGTNATGQNGASR